MPTNPNPNKIRRAIEFDKSLLMEFEDRWPGVSLWPVMNGLLSNFLKVTRSEKSIADYIKMGAESFSEEQANEHPSL